jgi:deoxyadenosine/deoxycytidine kinase
MHNVTGQTTMPLSEEQEEIRERILQLHKPREMEIINKIEKQHKYISSLYASLKTFREAYKVLAQLQQEYREFETFMYEEVDKHVK